MKSKMKILVFILSTIGIYGQQTEYQVGVGIADVTGPSAEVNMMGYANPAQISNGIHMRQYSRAFVIDDGNRRVAFVNVDCGMIDQIIKTEVVNRLQQKYGSTYTAQNVVLSGTHTHSGAAGFLQYLLFTITSLGFVTQTFEALVNGVVASIERAHNNMHPSYIYYNQGILLDANYNRSPAAYLNNPEAERAKYDYDTDKEMVQLKIVKTTGEALGIINWYAVHLTSMNNTNKLLSSDNKGYAAVLFESAINGNDTLLGKGPFVAAFAQSNLGDVSPNIMGPRCLDTGLPCDFVTSTCNNRTQLCVAFGPGKDMKDSTRIIGLRQFEKAWELYSDDSSMEPLSGSIQYVHQYVDMTNYTVDVQFPNSTIAKVKLCKPAMGYSFAAGTTDGPGAFDFTQGATSENPFWNLVVPAIQAPSQEQKDCHAPKPILLDTGEIEWPYSWQPNIVETQILRIGQLLIAAVPGEFTTMAGRRLRDQIMAQALGNSAPPNTKVVIAGLANTYSDYITTFEEYQIQRYEGGSTIYGPHTLSAYLDQYKKLTASMFKNEVVPPGPSPPNLLDVQISLVNGVVFDRPPYGKQFGDCLVNPYPMMFKNETAIATFVAGHPRNNLMTEETFLTVEKEEADGSWTVIATDANWETTFTWKRTSSLLGESEAQVRWEVPTSAEDGTYRIRHFGYYKEIAGDIFPYNGTSASFIVKTRGS